MSTDDAVKDVAASSPSSDTAGQRAPVPITLAVYRDLRVGLAVTAVMLAAAIIIQYLWKAPHCWQAALSEYFYTTAHSIFIAALLGLATLFFVYRGSSDTEDALLTLAGLAALTAALVPQGRPLVCEPAFLPPALPVEAVVVPNLVAVVVALVLGWTLTWWQNRYNATRKARSAGGTLALYLLRVVVAVGLTVLFLWPSVFERYAHGAAGVLLLSAFIATAFSTAYLAKREMPQDRRNYRRFYQLIAWLMLATLIAVVALHVTRPALFGLLWVIILESALILEFGAYWVVQTIDLWDSPDRSERLPDADREVLAQGCSAKGLAGLKSELMAARNADSGNKILQLL